MEIWLLERAEPLYKIYPWKALLRAGSRGCAETDYGQSLMRKMMMSYDPDPEEYARLAGFGYRMLAEAIKADLPYHISCPALLICGEKDKAGSAKSYNKKWHQREGLPLKWIKNAGHNSNTDQPDEVNRLIEKFISEVDRRGVPRLAALHFTVAGDGIRDFISSIIAVISVLVILVGTYMTLSEIKNCK